MTDDDFAEIHELLAELKKDLRALAGRTAEGEKKEGDAAHAD